MVISKGSQGVINVYSLPGCEFLRSIGGGVGAGPALLQFPEKICFSPISGHVLVADFSSNRVMELSLTGECVRSIGDGARMVKPEGLAVTADTLAVGTCVRDNQPQVFLFHLASGELLRVFGPAGKLQGQLLSSVGLRFTPDGEHLMIAENGNNRMSMFTRYGVFVRCIGAGTLSCPFDVAFSRNGDMIIVDKGNHRICVYSADCSTLLRTLGCRGRGPVEFRDPIAVTLHRGRLYVAEWDSARVQVFE